MYGANIVPRLERPPRQAAILLHLLVGREVHQVDYGFAERNVGWAYRGIKGVGDGSTEVVP